MSDQLNIKDLNKLILLSDKISEVHIKNLKSFPYYFFNGLQEAEVPYNISIKDKNSSFVHYYLTLSEENDNLNKRFEALQGAVKALFWKEVEVKLYLNDKEYKNE